MEFTRFGKLSVIWSTAASFQMGWHISALNMIQAVLTCKDKSNDRPDPGYILNKLPPCLPMSDTTFSVVTAAFTIGGLIGSLLASYSLDRFGRKGALMGSSSLFATGAGMMAGAHNSLVFGLGRMICGVGAGLATCTVPIMLAEISPPHIRGQVGVLNQVGIVIGILFTQGVGMNYAAPRQWRHVLSFSSSLAVVQLVVGFFMVDSPVWFKYRGKTEEAVRVAKRLWVEEPVVTDVEDMPLNEEARIDTQEAGLMNESLQKSESVVDVIMTMEYRRPLSIVALVMIAQQISGINAIMYYSTGVLSKIMPTSAVWISLMITIINAIMTFPAMALIERLGRMTLLQASAAGSVASLILTGFGLDFNLPWLASFAVIAFVASFAVGMGPVPYIIIPEVSPARSVGAMSTIGLSLNWLTNFCVALMFLPLRNYLSGGDSSREGRVFYVFAVIFSVVFVSFMKMFK